MAASLTADPGPSTAVAEALRDGYGHIDTAAAYGNETGVCDTIRDLGLARVLNAPHGGA